MDHATIQAIATEVAKQLPSYSWTALAIQVVLTGAAAAVVAYWGAYLKKTGEHLATKVHFQENLRQDGERTNLIETIRAQVAKSQLEANTKLIETIKAEVALRQLEASTKIVETVRSELAQRDWAAREWANLRRVKIEELLGKVNECRAYSDLHRDAAYRGEPLPAGDPVIALKTISQLYFPELRKEAKAFSEMHERFIFEGEKLRIKVAHASNEAEAARHREVYSGWTANIKVREEEKVWATLTGAARKLLEDIMGVQPGRDVVASAEDEGASPEKEDQQKKRNKLSEPRPELALSWQAGYPRLRQLPEKKADNLCSS
jgi:hypothetical protein